MLSKTVLRVEGLSKAILVKRVNRFTVMVDDGISVFSVHNTNTGRLEEFLVTGREVLIKPIKGVKLTHRLVSVKDVEGLYAIVDTITQNEAFIKLVDEGLIPYFKDCFVLKRNPKINDVVFDYLFKCGKDEVIIETKSAVLRGFNNEAMYPDCSTARGRKHVSKLIELSDKGRKAYVVFIAALPKPKCFKPYREADPQLEKLLKVALDSGVNVKALSIYMDPQGWVILDDADLPLCSEWLSSKS